MVGLSFQGMVLSALQADGRGFDALKGGSRGEGLAAKVAAALALLDGGAQPVGVGIFRGPLIIFSVISKR